MKRMGFKESLEECTSLPQDLCKLLDELVHKYASEMSEVAAENVRAVYVCPGTVSVRSLKAIKDKYDALLGEAVRKETKDYLMVGLR